MTSEHMTIGGLEIARQAGERMSAQPNYRSFSRMERRRSWMQDQMTPQPVLSSPHYDPSTIAPSAPARPPYFHELEYLAQMYSQGVLSLEEYESKKRQILGI